MPGWLLGSDRARAFELVADFLRLATRPAGLEECFRHACCLLCRLWEAQAVELWRFDPAYARLQWLAASSPDWECFGELTLEAFPDLNRILSEGEPAWVEQVAGRWKPFPPFLGKAASVLVVPVVASGRTYGCLSGLFGKGRPAPAAEEIEASSLLARALGWRLEAEAFRSERELLAEREETRQQLERELLRLGFSGPGLQHLVSAVRDRSGAEAVALYERRPSGFRRLAVAEATHLLPLELPVGGSALLPWERALEEAAPRTVSPDEIASALEPWLPRLAASHLPLRIIPLRTAKLLLGVLAVAGGERPAPASAGPAAAGREGEDWFGVSLLAAALENRGLRLLQEELERRYQLWFNHADEGVFWLDAAGRLLSANPTLLRHVGYPLAELEQRCLADFLPRADCQSLCAWLENPSEPAFQLSTRWQTKAGFGWELELSLHAPALEAEPSVLLGLARDTSRERKLEGRLRGQEARLQGLLDSVHDGVWLVGPDGRVEFANQRLGQLFGVDPRHLGPGRAQREAALQLNDRLLNPDAARERWAQLEAQPDQVCWDEIELVRPRRRVLERFARPLLDAQQQVVGRLEVYRDITSQRVVEDKVLQREKLATLGQLVSGIAHELNNPLTAVSGYAQLLLSAGLPAPLQEKARLLAHEAERAGRVSQNLLLFARESKPERQAVELTDLLERTLSLRAYELKVENIEVVREYTPEPCSVWADPHQLQQVFLNLLLNAEQAIRSQRDQGRIRVRTGGPAAGGAGASERVRVEIADDGPGIPPVVLPHIFEPFFTTKAPREGTGLGLSISQAIVKEHGGEIFVQSAPGQGAIFRLEFPLHQPESPSPPPRSLREPLPAAVGEPRRILVVDDEPAVAHLIADALSQQGYLIRAHTESRLALFEALREPFHLAICDIRMPEIDGPAFYRALREQRSVLARRLLFTTGDTLARETADFLAEVGLPYLAKPFRVEELRAMVRQLLSDGDRSEPETSGRGPRPARSS